MVTTEKEQSPADRALPPGLYLVATPIGAARDMTLRALDILRSADVIAAEDTRQARKLMQLHGVPIGGRPLLAYHDHNGDKARPDLLQALQDGKVVAYVSDAGTPLVADPGFDLARAAVAQGSDVFAAPGASALLAALSVAGLPTDRFLFAGFPPRGGKLADWLAEQQAADCTLILYESPRRVHQLLAALRTSFGEETKAALCRELTKRHEEVLRGSLAELATAIEGRELKGEIVLVVGAAEKTEVSEEMVRDELLTALAEMRVKDAAASVANRFGLPRREVYQRALELQAKGGSK